MNPPRGWTCPDCGWSFAAAWTHPVCATTRTEETPVAIINSASIADTTDAPAGPLHEYRDNRDGSTWQLDEADAARWRARNPFLVKVSEQPLTGATTRRPATTYDLDGVDPARQVADATRA